jgi:hypothetical protein
MVYFDVPCLSLTISDIIRTRLSSVLILTETLLGMEQILFIHLFFILSPVTCSRGAGGIFPQLKDLLAWARG